MSGPPLYSMKVKVIVAQTRRQAWHMMWQSFLAFWKGQTMTMDVEVLEPEPRVAPRAVHRENMTMH